MENASKALLMAAGMLIGILILTLIITLFASSTELSNGYEREKKAEEIQQFNVNFMKYIGKNLTIHEVVTICNFAIEKGFNREDIIGFKTKADIKGDNPNYKITINSYSPEGYIDSISFSESAY